MFLGLWPHGDALDYSRVSPQSWLPRPRSLTS